MWPAYLTALVLLAIYGAHRLVLIAQYWRRARGAEPVAPELGSVRPIVTVQLPIFNERYVAARLIDAVVALDWPRDRLEIQVLDDSTDDTADICAERVCALRAAGFDIDHLRRARRDGFKAGALAEGLRRARGSLLLILDADFLPPPDLLQRTLGHFADPNIGMVQVRWEHINRDYSPLTRVQALLLDGHFVVEQSVRARTGKLFNFNGTAGVWRREAIEQAGGWQHDTLTEDLDLSYRALLRGWRFEYLLGVAAPAELPVDMNAFKSQQFRWAKGSVQVARKLLGRLFASDLPRPVKIEAFFHLTQNVPYLITLVLALLAVPALALRDRHGLSESLAVDLPLLVLTTGTIVAYCVTSQRALRAESPWRVGLRVPMLIAVTAGICVNQARAVIEGLCGLESDFVRTPKHGIVARGQAWRRARYRGARSLVPLAELALAGYFAFAVVCAIAAGRPLALPILGLFFAGFAYVGVRSLLRL
jgi:glycosyltransferase involved in cell wall biosynthesis